MRSPEVLAGAAATQRPWTTILLLGTDEGPGNWGARTDTIILVAAQHGTGRAAAFGIPRNLAQVAGRRQAEALRRALERPLRLRARAPRALPGRRRSRRDRAEAGGLAAARVRVDYFALVNLHGFADLVDALGGVRILVKERLVDSVTRPAWGEPKPTDRRHAGANLSLLRREALAYVRSRKASSDYTRMARQRCFLSALADQLDPVQVLRNFGSLAKTVETSVSTDVPLDRFPASSASSPGSTRRRR